MPSPTNYDKLFNQAQGNELIGVLRGIKTAIGKNIGEVTLTENGEYSAEDLGYDSISDITVEVPNTYDVSDEGKVVSNGNLVSQSSTTKTSNGTYDTTLNDEVVINVPNTYSASDEGKVVNSGALVSQSSTTKNANGTYDTTLNNQVTINVPNTYTASDEGKVVDNGALVSQTSQNISQNGTYDTTLKNEVVVSVSGGGSNIPIISQSDWDNMTTAQKQSYGLIIIQNSNVGFRRGAYVNGADYTETDGVHIWTDSVGGYDAAMYVQNGYWDEVQNQFVPTATAVSVVYTSVQSTPYNCNDIATLSYSSRWTVSATDSITDGTNDYESGDLVNQWLYSSHADFYIWKN